MADPPARFTIRNMMIAIAAVAGLIALLDAHPVATFSLALCAWLAVMPWVMSRRRPRLASWGFLAWALWANLSVAAFYAFLPYLRGHPLAIIASIPTIPIAVGFGAAWAGDRRGWRARVGAVLVVIAAAVVPVSMVATFWPLRLAVALSAPALGRLADRIEAGGRLAAPEWAGVYRIVAANRATGGGDVALVCDPNPGGISALVRRAATAPPSTRPGLLMDLGAADGKGGRWYYLDED